jgi:hypothetical protein
VDAEREEYFKAVVVSCILDSNPEKALDLLCNRYRVPLPKLSVGVFKGRSKGVRAVYSGANKEIRAAKRDYFYDPFVIIHEFYHHLRTVGGEHRGTEKNADKFALDFIGAYNNVAAALKKGKLQPRH